MFRLPTSINQVKLVIAVVWPLSLLLKWNTAAIRLVIQQAFDNANGLE